MLARTWRWVQEQCAFLLVIGVCVWLVGLPIYRYLNPADYSGSGTGAVVVTVHANDGAHQIGTTLHREGVVASVHAFTKAASDNDGFANVQPGSYTLKHHMSAAAAVRALLDPRTRIDRNVLVPEGATTLDVAKRLSMPPCTKTSPADTVCGEGLPVASVRKALTDVDALGLPTDYSVNGKPPTSAEGFLFPATYTFDDKTSATNALQQMVSQFTDSVRSTNFTARARALHLTPYQELIIASIAQAGAGASAGTGKEPSIAQAEAKYAQDMPKVVRVILNRLAAHRTLQIDAISAYGAKLAGLDPAKVVYSTLPGAYNTYTHLGLPPTPIGNPGAEALKGAAHPAAGNWLYYVNGDADGHLVFTNSPTQFAKDQKLCHDKGWGCAAP